MLIILRGPAASGKSTFTAELREQYPDLVVVNRDSIRHALYGVFYGPPIDENFVSVIEKRAVRDALAAGKVVVSDNTNLNAKFLNPMVDIAYQLGKEVVLFDHFKEVPLDECLRRNAARDRVVPEKALSDQWMRSQRAYTLPERPVDIAPYEPDTSLPRAVLVDLDGTAALMGDRSPYDDLNAGIDLRNDAVHAAVKALRADGVKIIYLSGRQDRARQVTLGWLIKHDYPMDGELFMRKSGDQRKDWIVKDELFRENVQDRYNVLFCLDDRNQVVDMYRRKGLAVFQVNEGDF